MYDRLWNEGPLWEAQLYLRCSIRNNLLVESSIVHKKESKNLALRKTSKDRHTPMSKFIKQSLPMNMFSPPKKASSQVWKGYHGRRIPGTE